MSDYLGCLSDLIVGQEFQVKGLLQSIASSRLHHCHLFVGEEGIGKRLTALACAQYLLCEKPLEKACGFCPPCMRVAKNQSEALLIIEPENQQIKLEQAAQIAQFFRLTKLTKNRIVIVDDIDSLNGQSANSLLKLLEEPPADSFFFLISSRPERVLATIRSRSQELRFKPISFDSLKRKSKAEDWQIEASMGSFSKLFAWRDEEKMIFRANFLDWLSNLSQSSYLTLSSEIKLLVSSKDTHIDAIELLQMFLRDCIAYQLGINKAKFFSDQTELVEQYSKLGLDALLNVSDLCNTMEQDLVLNLDKDMQWQSLSFQMQRLLSQTKKESNERI